MREHEMRSNPCIIELRELLRSGAICRHQLGQKKKRLAKIACLLESVLIYDFSAGSVILLRQTGISSSGRP